MTRWEEEYPEATINGRKRKLKAFYDGNLAINMIQELKRFVRPVMYVDFHLLWGPPPSESIDLKVRDVKVMKGKYIVVHIPETKTIRRPVPIPLGSKLPLDVKPGLILEWSHTVFSSSEDLSGGNIPLRDCWFWGYISSEGNTCRDQHLLPKFLRERAASFMM